MRRILFILLIAFAIPSYAQLNFQNHFDSVGLKGSTTVFDLKNNRWYYSDSIDATVATLPASTFKIPNSLFALECKAVTDENEVIKWDSVPKLHLGKVVDAWNKDTDLSTAYRNSTIWFYVEMAKRIGRKQYKKKLKQCNYGNGNLSEPGTDFWNYGEFAISPTNQIEFLVKLYHNNLPFSKSTLEKVKNIMRSPKTDAYVYYDKTGWTRRQNQDIGWWVGYVETGNNVYFFATRLLKNETDNNANFAKGRKDVTKKILNDIITEGKLSK